MNKLTLFCTNCGEEVDKNAEFCPHCGEKIVEDNLVKEYKKNVSHTKNPNPDSIIKRKEKILYVLITIFFLILFLGSYILMKTKGY